MKWIEVKVIFESAFAEMAGDLIALIFYDLGLKGVSLEELILNRKKDGEMMLLNSRRIIRFQGFSHSGNLRTKKESS